MNIEWNADKYTKDFSFVHQYGRALFELIDGEKLSVLDLGCGNGRLTRALCDLGFDTEGMDASRELLETARRTYPELNFMTGDATNFQTERRYDVVFSNAIFHWIDREKQPEMLACVHRALKPGGQFIFELGGHGNNARIHGALKRAFERRGLNYVMPFYFPTIGAYASLLERAGFLVRNAVLFDRPTELSGRDGLRDWLQMFIRTPFEGIGDDLREEITAEVVAELGPELCRGGKWYADYVRLRCKAIRE